MDGHMESDSSQPLKFKPSGGKWKIILNLESFLFFFSNGKYDIKRMASTRFIVTFVLHFFFFFQMFLRLQF